MSQNSFAHPKLKYFGTDGIRGKVGEFPITAEFILKLGWAIGVVLGRTGYGKVLIGKDTRISGYMMESVLEAGLSCAGINIHLVGPMPTPAIAFLTKKWHDQAGIVISASHNHYADNGIKLFSADGYKLSEELELAIEQQLELPLTTVEPKKLGKAFRIVEAAENYIEFCKNTVASKTLLKGLKIILDCANGATYHIAPRVFQELGANVIAIGVQPNGLNINLECGALDPDIIRKKVLESHADVGIAFDGDGDRVVLVDNDGNIFDGDDLLYILVKHRINQGTFKGGVVGTIMSNLGLEEALSQENVDFVRSQVGDQQVIKKLLKHNWWIGGEPSGHVVCRDISTTGDGIITALQVLRAMCIENQSLSQLTNTLKKYPQILLDVPVTKKEKPEQLTEIKDTLKKSNDKLAKKGRIVLRRSGTQSLVRIMIESEDEKLAKELAEELAEKVKNLLNE